MLQNLSISGELLVSNKKSKAAYTIHNLTNTFVSESFMSELGYYNTNLANFPNNVFNTGDLIMISFAIRENGIDYKSNIFYFIDNEDSSVVINVNLDANWNYVGMMQSTVLPNNKVNIKFMTSTYQYIWYILYYNYNGAYKELEKIKVDKQDITIGPFQQGKYKLLAYVTDDNKLLCNAVKYFDIDGGEISQQSCGQTTYFDWE